MTSIQSNHSNQTAKRSQQNLSKNKANSNDGKLNVIQRNENFVTGVRYFNCCFILKWKIASQKRNDVQVFHGKTVLKAIVPKVTVPKITRVAECKLLFAGPHPISEYMDNISRVGQVVMSNNLHCHDNCFKNTCKHAFTVDVTKRPTRRNQMLLKS